MRYKALPPSLRAAPVPQRRTDRSSAGNANRNRVGGPILLLLVPALLIPWMSANAAAAMSVTPSTARPGASVLVQGSGFAARSRGQLTFDGGTKAMAT